MLSRRSISVTHEPRDLVGQSGGEWRGITVLLGLGKVKVECRVGYLLVAGGCSADSRRRHARSFICRQPEARGCWPGHGRASSA
jgi:hypothetical protein